MHAIDTNVLVRLITRDDPAQVAAAERFVASGAWVSHVVLAEFSWVLDSVYGVSPAAIATAIEMLLAHQSLALQEPAVIEAALAHFRRKPALGFSDCLVLEIAIAAGREPLGTFDRALGRLPGARQIPT